MKKILVFSGTTEGRKLAELLSYNSIPAVICVATQYGKQVMEPLPFIEIHTGRMGPDEMQEFFGTGDFIAVADATHPFATEVSENIKNCSDKCGLPYLRLKRNTDMAECLSEDAVFFSSHDECAKVLLHMGGNILLTTGSRELDHYCKNAEIRNRLYVRVLPNEESISACLKHGLKGKHIIAMQGPFSTEMNAAMIREFDIQILVTKESGEAGGFKEKAEAAHKLNINLFVISNPDNTEGLSFSEVCDGLERLTGTTLIKPDESKEKQSSDAGQGTLTVTLAGAGMGNVNTLTLEAKKKIKGADYIFGAERLLKDVRNWNTGLSCIKMFPYYFAKDIIPVLEDISSENDINAVVLFSGDSGFYSGCHRLYEDLTKWGKETSHALSVKILPGISSVSYLASAIQTDWNDADLISIHGKGDSENWQAELLSKVKYNKKVFVLMSGADDVKKTGALLSHNGLGHVKIMTGYRLSYPDEKITECTVEECMNITEEGLYILCIYNENPEKRYIAPHNADPAFIRGSVPMTKEEIRDLAVCKLKLTDDAVVYDTGSGTGSVAVEIAGLSESIRVYAIENDGLAIGLIRQNKDKFRLPNIKIVQGTAPEALANLPCPSHAFIGGSDGKLKEILDCLYSKNPQMRVVITAVSLETVSEIKDILNNMPVVNEELIQVQVSRSKKAGSHHLMQAENPVYICSFDFSAWTRIQ